MREATTMPPPAASWPLTFWVFYLESSVRVTCDVGYIGYLYANFSLPRPLRSRLRPNVRDRQTYIRQTSDAHHRLMLPPYGRGITNKEEYRTKYFDSVCCYRRSSTCNSMVVDLSYAWHDKDNGKNRTHSLIQPLHDRPTSIKTLIKLKHGWPVEIHASSWRRSFWILHVFSLGVSFLMRDAMRKRGLCCRPVSVCLSRWCIVSRRLKISSNFFLGPVALVFLSPTAGTQFQGEPLQHGRKIHGHGEILRF